MPPTPAPVALPPGFRVVSPPQPPAGPQPLPTGRPQAPVVGPPILTTPPKPADVPSGYRQGPNGTLEAITGGPADPHRSDVVVTTPGNTTLSGDDYLATIDPGLAGQVRALSEGRRAFPTGTALKDPKVQELIAAATQFDPALDASNAASRVKARLEFTSGATARNITALNTALGHLGTLSQAAEALENRSIPTWNAIANTAESATGDSRVNNFNLARQAVVDELERVFRGAGGGSEKGIEAWKQAINSSQSPEQLRAAIKTAVDLLDSRLTALGDQYENSMKRTIDPVTLLNPHAQDVYNQIASGGIYAGNAAGGNGPPSLAAPGGGAPPAGPQGGPPAGPQNGPAPSAFDNGAPGQGVATGQTRDVFDPETAGLLNALVQQGRPYNEAVAVARQKGYEPPSPTEYAAAIRWQKQHPSSPYNASNPTRPGETTFNERFSASPGGAYLGGARSGALAGFDDELAGLGGALTGGDYTQSRDAFRGNAAAVAANQPGADLAGTVTGGTLSALGGEAALGGAGMAGSALRSAIADTAYGAAAGAGSTDYGSTGQPSTAIDRLYGAGQGAVAGVAGSYGGNLAGRGLSRFARGVADPSAAALIDAGTQMTLGQVYGRSGPVGRTIKGVEDRLAGLPVVGDMINARRAEGVRHFNTTAFDKALEPIGGTVDGLVGEQAVERAQQQVSQAFTEALAGKGAVPDQAFADSLGEAVSKVGKVKRLGAEVVDQIGEILQPYADDAALSGEALDDISRNLRTLRNAYAGDPLAVPLARRIDQVENAIFGLFDRQSAGTIPAYKTARQAYRRLSVIEDAVLKGKNTEGVFTPAQLGQADRTNAVRYSGKRAAARGEGVFHDYQRAGQNVLPSKVPDSGTAGRAALIPLALIGAGGGVDTMTGGEGQALTLGTILAALYTKGGQRLLTKPGRGISSAAGRKLLESPATRRVLSATGAAGSAGAITDQR